jgi:hypothetical protein
MITSIVGGIPKCAEVYRVISSCALKSVLVSLHSNNMAKKSSSSDNPCPICLSPIESEASPDGCGHRFCHRCIKKWSSVRLPSPRRRTRVRSASRPSLASSGGQGEGRRGGRACRSVGNGRRRICWRIVSSMPSADAVPAGESAPCSWPMLWWRLWPLRTDLNVIVLRNSKPLPPSHTTRFLYCTCINYNNT